MSTPVEITVKHNTVKHTLRLDPAECVYDKIARLLDVPKGRIKIIVRGRLLPPPGDTALPNLIISGSTYLVTATASDAHLPSDRRRRAAEAMEMLQQSYQMLTWAFIKSWLLWLWTMLLAVPRVAISFVSSMVVPPEPAAGHRSRLGGCHVLRQGQGRLHIDPRPARHRQDLHRGGYSQHPSHPRL